MKFLLVFSYPFLFFCKEGVNDITNVDFENALWGASQKMGAEKV